MLRKKKELAIVANGPCANCGYDVQTAFCPHCGQSNQDHSLSLRRFLVEAFNEQIGTDAKVWRTVWQLVRRPGFLTREFVAGRRVRYMTPFKTYLLTSVLFFVIVGWRAQSSVGPNDTIFGPPTVNGQASKNKIAFGSRKLPLTVAEYDKEQASSTAKKHDSPVEQFILRRIITARALGPGEMAQRMINNAPKIIFFLMPFFALLLHFFFWGTRRMYIEHLIFALHGHAFLFLTLAFFELIHVPYLRPLAFVFLYPPYAFVALRSFYQQGTLITLAKGALLSGLYLCFLLAVVIATAIFTIALS